MPQCLPGHLLRDPTEGRVDFEAAEAGDHPLSPWARDQLWAESRSERAMDRPSDSLPTVIAVAMRASFGRVGVERLLLVFSECDAGHP